MIESVVDDGENMNRAFLIIGNIYLALGVLLFGLTVLAKECVVSIVNFATQFTESTVSFQIDLSLCIILAVASIIIGLLLLGLGAFVFKDNKRT